VLPAFCYSYFLFLVLFYVCSSHVNAKLNDILFVSNNRLSQKLKLLGLTISMILYYF
jgi:hypothetical protein